MRARDNRAAETAAAVTTTPAVTTTRTGPIGRTVRLLLAALLVFFAIDLIDAGTADYRRTEVLGDLGFWILTIAVIDVFSRFPPLPRRLRWLGPVGLAAAVVVAAAISLASSGSPWGPPLSDLVWGLHVALLLLVAVSLVPAVLLGTPACELMVWSDIGARWRGNQGPPAIHPCLAGLHLIDTWETTRRTRQHQP